EQQDFVTTVIDRRGRRTYLMLDPYFEMPKPEPQENAKRSSDPLAAFNQLFKKESVSAEPQHLLVLMGYRKVKQKTPQNPVIQTGAIRD
ncbi:MAG: hypothetical protein AAFV88_05430, partial [Planctomycetota bacterium]